VREAPEKITSLRAILASASEPHKRVPLGLDRLDEVLAGGLRRGTLHEIFASPSQEGAAVGFTAALSARLNGPVLWIAQDYSLLEQGELAPPGFSELGFRPEQLFLLRIPDVTSALRAAMEALNCAALSSVVIELSGESKLLDLVAYRKLLLAAGESGVTALLLRFCATPSLGGAETRWLVRALSSEGGLWGLPAFDVELQRNRAGRGGRWQITWSCDDGFFRAADHCTLATALGDRPHPARLEDISAA
jgi:protein ImuA